MELDFSDDYVVMDGLETLYHVPVRTEDVGNESYSIDFETGTMHTPLPVEQREFEIKNALFRLVTERDQALVKQIFQRGVALASLDFNVADVVVEVWKATLPENHVPIKLDDRIERVVGLEENRQAYIIVAFDDSSLTDRIRIACRRNQ